MLENSALGFFRAALGIDQLSDQLSSLEKSVKQGFKSAMATIQELQIVIDNETVQVADALATVNTALAALQTQFDLISGEVQPQIDAAKAAQLVEFGTQLDAVATSVAAIYEAIPPVVPTV